MSEHEERLRAITLLLGNLSGIFNRDTQPGSLVMMAKVLCRQQVSVERWEVIVDHVVEVEQFMPSVRQLIEIESNLPNPKKLLQIEQVRQWLAKDGWNFGMNLSQGWVDEALIESGMRPGILTSREVG